MSLKEVKISGKDIYNGKILKLVLDEVRLSDGSVAMREIVRHAHGVAVLFVRDGEVLLVRQFRYACGKEIYEIPAGMVNPGEDPQTAAGRELREETGYVAELKPFGDIYPSPGYTDEVIHIFLASAASYTSKAPDSGEILKDCFIPLEKVVKMIENGEITDAKTVAAIYKYLLLK